MRKFIILFPVYNDWKSLWRLCEEIDDQVKANELSEIMRSIPDQFKLHHNYPNPFNPITNISYELSNPSRVTITIYDLKGREIKTIVNEWKQPGYYSAVWNSTDNRNNAVSSGIYFYRMKTNTFHKTLKMLLLK